MKFEIGGHVPVLMAVCAYAAYTESLWWLVGVGLWAGSCVINPRWSRQEGWKFLL